MLDLFTLAAARKYTDSQLSSLIGGLPPSTFDTIKEIGDYLNEHTELIDLITYKLDENSILNGGTYGSYLNTIEEEVS